MMEEWKNEKYNGRMEERKNGVPSIRNNLPIFQPSIVCIVVFVEYN
jgi:hypothetical protein